MVEKEFLHLRRYCLQVVKMADRDSVQALTDALTQVFDVKALQQLQDYVAVPLLDLLRTRKSSEEIILDVVNCLTNLLSLTEVRKWKLFSQIVFHVVMHVSKQEDVQQAAVTFADVSEELKSSVSVCLTELLRRSNQSVLQLAFGSGFLPQMGHIIYILLQMAETERSQEVRISAMNCLRAFRGPSTVSNELKVTIGDCLANFIPGISMTMTKVATGSGLAGQVITVTALKVFQELVCIVLSDKALEAAQQRLQRPPLNNSVPHKMKSVTRSDEWLKNTSGKLAILVKKLSQLDSSSNVKVRLALSEWSRCLLVECKNSMSLAAPTFISILITLSCDEFVQVSTFCKSALSDVAETLQDDEKSFIEVLQENLLSLVLDLSRIIRHCDDAKKLSAINKLHGYFTILGPTIDVVISSATHFDKLSMSLMQLLELDCSDVRLVAERNNMAYSVTELEQLGSQQMRKSFRYFRDNKIHDSVFEVCQLLGKFGELQLLVDHFMDQFHKSAVFRKEAALLLNYIISGTRFRLEVNSSALQKELFEISTRIIEDYINPLMWDLQTAPNDSNSDPKSHEHSSDLRIVKVGRSQSSISIAQLNSNITQICLLLEGLWIMATVLKEEFRPLLIKVLYEVLEKLGNSNVVISRTALLTVSKIAHFCSYRSISDMLLNNYDYLLNSILLKLRYKPMDGKGPLVLCVALEHGDHQLLDVIDDVFKEICHNLDARPDDRSIPHLQVLLFLVRAITKWYPPQRRLDVPSLTDKTTRETNKGEDVGEYIAKYHRLRQLANAELEEVSSNERETDVHDRESVNVAEMGDDESKDEKKPIPRHVQLVVEVLRRCCHHLPSENTSIRILILDILDSSLSALQDHEDQLLPMVHKIWSPLLLRFGADANLLTMKKAFHTLCVMCTYCSDFLRGRVVKEIWPNLVQFLEKHVSISAKKDDSAFYHTVAYKLLLDILSNVGDLAITLEVPELEIDRLSSAVIYYLNRHQPIAVQEATIDLFVKLFEWTPDLIWLKLADLCDESGCYVNANCELEDIKVGGYPANEELSENIAKLYRRLKR